jgi:hypothetical protein
MSALLTKVSELNKENKPPYLVKKVDRKYIDLTDFGALSYPSCPAAEANTIAEHACRKH